MKFEIITLSVFSYKSNVNKCPEKKQTYLKKMGTFPQSVWGVLHVTIVKQSSCFHETERRLSQSFSFIRSFHLAVVNLIQLWLDFKQSQSEGDHLTKGQPNFLVKLEKS